MFITKEIRINNLILSNKNELSLRVGVKIQWNSSIEFPIYKVSFVWKRWVKQPTGEVLKSTFFSPIRLFETVLPFAKDCDDCRLICDLVKLDGRNNLGTIPEINSISYYWAGGESSPPDNYKTINFFGKLVTKAPHLIILSRLLRCDATVANEFINRVKAGQKYESFALSLKNLKNDWMISADRALKFIYNKYS